MAAARACSPEENKYSPSERRLLRLRVRHLGLLVEAQSLAYAVAAAGGLPAESEDATSARRAATSSGMTMWVWAAGVFLARRLRERRGASVATRTLCPSTSLAAVRISRKRWERWRMEKRSNISRGRMRVA